MPAVSIGIEIVNHVCAWTQGDYFVFIGIIFESVEGFPIIQFPRNFIGILQ